MSKFTRRVMYGTGKYAGDAVKGTATFVGDVIKKNLWILIVLFALNYFIDHKINLGFLGKVTTDPSTKLNLDEGEVANAVIYMDDRIIVIQKAGEEPKQYVGVRKAKITKFEDGEVEVDVKNKGFGLEPGFTVAAGDGLRLGLDVQYAYWKRWGLLGGVTIPVNDRRFSRVRGHLGLGYTLPNRWLSSTSVFGAVDTSKNPLMGFRTRFGGGL